ncbi:hypothetical protein FGB62_3g252 [Gracilaria domingensis]|nr:hypothetical protein FGB62_3g252 [Gracilaria domingensis]
MSHITDSRAEHTVDQLVVPSRQREQQHKHNNALKTPPRRAPRDQFRGLLTRLQHAVVDNWAAFSTNVNAVIGTLIPEKDNTFVRSPLQPTKVCAMLPPSVYTVSALKHAARSLGITINDMLYTAVSGATRAYLTESGDDADALTGLRVGIPFNNHAIGKNGAQDVSNRFAIMTLPLHVHHSQLRERLRCCVRTMRIVKSGTTPVLLMTLLDVLSRLPTMLRRALWSRVTRSGSVVFTNVPGPRQAVSIGGIEVSGLHFFAPSDGHCGVVVGIHSYNGRICIGVYGDEGRISNPQRFVELLDEEIKALIRFGDVKL